MSDPRIDRIAARWSAAQTVARVTVDGLLADLPDDTYSNVVALFPDWTAGETVAVGTVRQFDGALYRVVQAHTTQADWTPPTVPALWTAVRQTQGPTVDPWVQPTGSSDAYQIGDRVTFEGQTWESTAANNVWAPGVFGWVVV